MLLWICHIAAIESPGICRMFLPRNLCVVVLVGIGLGAPLQAAEDIIGRVKKVSGEVTILSGDRQRTPQPGSVLKRMDTVRTGRDGSIGITFRDDSRTALGPDSEMQMSEFRFDPAKREYAFVSRIFRGSMMFVSGLIAKLSPGTPKVETPVATLGIRGTRFIVRVDDE